MDVPADQVKRKGRLQPGKLFLVDLERGVIVDDADVKREVAGAQPYGEWFEQGIVHLADLPAGPGAAGARAAAARAPARVRLHAGGPAGAAGADRGQGRRADRLDGQRRRARSPVRPPAAAVQLLQPALRAGHEPADRLDPRVDRDDAPAAVSGPSPTCSTRLPSTRISSSMQTPICSTASAAAAPRRQLDLQGPHGRHHVADRRGRGRHRDGARPRVLQADDGARGRHQHPDPLGPGDESASGPPSRRCSRSPASITTSCARARACRPDSCSSPASRARSTTSRR